MLQDSNVERYVSRRLKPLEEQIKILQAEMFKLMQAKNLHLQNVIECKICKDTGFKKVGETDKKITIARCDCSK
tara:strand:- start:19 stop:240 length:222 start_codon:yes stop_codon:yes gene_type:complete